MTQTRYWLMKSEPESYGIEHLKKDKKTPWTGVRNFQARNFMHEMQIGDTVFFYHSNCAVPGIYGIAKVVSKPYPDPTQFDTNSPYCDKRATKEKPIWDLVDIAYVRTLPVPIPLSAIRDSTKLQSMAILQKGSRLSVTPVDTTHAEILLSL